MKISEMIKKKMTFSFEVFPPKEEQPLEPLANIIKQLSAFRPDFISCTYGAGGTSKGRSLEVCKEILHSGNEAMAHFTCIGNSKDDVRRTIGEFTEPGIENVLALQGDLPAGWENTQGDFEHADQLIAFLKGEFPGLCLAAACYPEMHLYAPNFEEDIAHLRKKQNNGAEVLMTQLCHDVDAFKRFRDRIDMAGIHLPIIFGLMPVLSKESIVKMTLITGCSIPRDLSAIIGKYGEKPDEFKKAGKEYTVNQIYRYMSAGIDGLHIYVLNKYTDVADIINAAGILQYNK